LEILESSMEEESVSWTAAFTIFINLQHPATFTGSPGEFKFCTFQLK
jgi:hypothetical protein